LVEVHGQRHCPQWSRPPSCSPHKLKFASKKALDRDYIVMPLEGQWWADDMESLTDARDKSQWDWTLMIMVPEWIPKDMFTAVVEQVAMKDRPCRLDDLRLETLSEGLCVQVSLPDEG